MQRPRAVLRIWVSSGFLSRLLPFFERDVHPDARPMTRRLQTKAEVLAIEFGQSGARVREADTGRLLFGHRRRRTVVGHGDLEPSVVAPGRYPDRAAGCL